MDNKSNVFIHTLEKDCSSCNINTNNIDKQSILTNSIESPTLEKNLLDREKSIIRKKKKSKQRCFNCKKKIGLIELMCKCSDKNKFCSNCILSETHNCTYDYKNDKTILINKLVKVENKKITKI